jgi:flagellar hook-associated protein 3 FlgL
MTVDPNYLRGLGAAISQGTAAQQKLTNELSSGMRVMQLADDPVAAAGNVALASSLGRLDSFVKSSTAEQSLMQASDSVLGSVVSQVTTAIGLAVGASNGTLTAANLGSIEAQVRSIRDGVVSLANSAYQGKYLFSGSQGNTKPFVLDQTSDPAVASYLGDNAVNKAETPSGQQIALTLPGSSVFQASGADLLGTLNRLVSDLGAAAKGTGSSATLVADSSALTEALTAVSGQRAILDSGLKQLTQVTGYAQTQSALLQAQQSKLLSADPAQVATDLKSAEVQQQALLAVTAALEGAQNLFSYLK